MIITAKWVRENIIQNCLSSIERYRSTEQNINRYLPQCTKTVYTVGFSQRALHVHQENLPDYDFHSGIIVPRLSSVGIGFPRQITTPLGDTEMNAGLWKFLNDLKIFLPIWQHYDV